MCAFLSSPPQLGWRWAGRAVSTRPGGRAREPASCRLITQEHACQKEEGSWAGDWQGGGWVVVGGAGRKWSLAAAGPCRASSAGPALEREG